MTSSDRSSRVDLDTKEELGDIARDFNKYLQSIEDGLKEDMRFIADTQVVMDRVANELTWDTQNNTLTHISDEIKLTKKETELLKLFVKNNSKISTTQEIFHLVWDDDSSVATTDSLKALISRLRKKLPDADIETFYNIGYRLNF